MRAIRNAAILAGLAIALHACGGCNDEPPPGTDDGVADAGDLGAPDAASDLGPLDVGPGDQGSLPDMAAPDVGADASDLPGSACGNGVLDDGEACDGALFGADSCASRGYTSGELRCDQMCAVSEAACDTCGDGRCGMSETASSCPAECAAVSVAAGDAHSCAVRADGSVWCWGARAGHRAGGMGDVATPHPIAGLAGATSVAVGEAHTCAIVGGTVSCWGRNAWGELGRGSLTREEGEPAVVALPAPALQLTAGRQHTCAVLDDGDLYCWGRADYAQTGSAQYSQPSPRRVPLTNVGFATAGEHHTCAASGTNGYCWGWNDQGQVGSTTRVWATGPTSVAGFMRALGSGARHTCAYIFNPAAPPALSGLFCWGSNGYGQLGAPPSPDVLGPQRVLAGATEVEGGSTFTCVINGPEPAPVWCWGRNDFGQLGDGSVDLRYSPGATLGVDTAVEITGGTDHACARLADGQLRCWGRNQFGQVGAALAEPFHATPVAPEGFQ